MANEIIAPSIVQNLNMASDLYGDRSNIRNPYDLGVQLFEVDVNHVFLPLRKTNTHLLNGETEKRPSVGTDFEASFNWSSFLPKGFASDQFYYAVTSIGLSAVSFGRVTAPTPTPNTALGDTVMTTPGVEFTEAALGQLTGSISSFPGQVLGNVYRSTMGSAWAEYRQDGRKTSFIFDNLLNVPSVTQLNDASASGLSLQSNRAMLPVPFLLSPRNTNQSQEVVVIHFENDSTGPYGTVTGKCGIVDVTQTATDSNIYALVYKLDFGGYFCDAKGNPADQEFTLANARLAADYRPVGA